MSGVSHIALAAYGSLDQGDAPYELQNCEIVARLKGTEHWFRFGDCDSARIEISSTKIQRKARNQRVRTVAIEAVTDVVASLSLRAMQYSDDVRALALLGTPVAHTQAAGAWNLDIRSVKLNAIYFAPALDLSTETAITGTELLFDDENPGEAPEVGSAIAGIVVEVVDQSAGAFRIKAGVEDGDSVRIAGVALGIVETDKRTRIDFGVETAKELELKVRGLSAIGVPYIFSLNKWLGTPSGIDLIGGDDFSGQDLTGTLSAVDGKIGTWQRLAA